MRTAGIRKITFGFVTQIFNDEGKCIEQEFTAGDPVEYEDKNDEHCEAPDNEQYQPFHMLQPGDTPETIADLKTDVAQFEADHYDRQIGGGE